MLKTLNLRGTPVKPDDDGGRGAEVSDRKIYAIHRSFEPASAYS
jgi:hypothetical protein